MNCPKCNNELNALKHTEDGYFCQNCKLFFEFDSQGNEKPQFEGLEYHLRDRTGYNETS